MNNLKNGERMNERPLIFAGFTRPTNAARVSTANISRKVNLIIDMVVRKREPFAYSAGASPHFRIDRIDRLSGDVGAGNGRFAFPFSGGLPKPSPNTAKPAHRRCSLYLASCQQPLKRQLRILSQATTRRHSRNRNHPDDLSRSGKVAHNT